MKELFLLFGFKSEKTAESILKALRARGYRVNHSERYNKLEIQDFVNTHRELHAVIVKEYLDGGEKYSAREMAALSDESNVNIIAVIGAEHRGKASMRDLYCAGIVNAAFAEGRRGVDPEKLADLIIRPRTRKQAREYYGIYDAQIDHEFLDYEEYRDAFKYLVDKTKGASMADRLTVISRWFTAKQMAAFIEALPVELAEILREYEEYVDLYNRLRRKGFIKTPLAGRKQTKRGLSPEILKRQLEKELIEDGTDDPDDVKNASEETARVPDGMRKELFAGDVRMSSRPMTAQDEETSGIEDQDMQVEKEAVDSVPEKYRRELDRIFEDIHADLSGLSVDDLLNMMEEA